MTKRKAPEERLRMGRPPAFESVKDLEDRCQAYASRIETDDDFVPTVNELAISLGISRETLNQYRNKPDFADALKNVFGKLESWWEKRLAANGCTGAIFWLKNQGWTDKTEQVVTANVNLREMPDADVDTRIAALMANVPMMQSIKPNTEH